MIIFTCVHLLVLATALSCTDVTTGFIISRHTQASRSQGTICPGGARRPPFYGHCSPPHLATSIERQEEVAHRLDPAVGNVLHALDISDRTIDAPAVTDAVTKLRELYEVRGIDARYSSPPEYDGDWEMLSTPAFPGSVGKNEQGEERYTMGRLTFNMIRPTDLVCSLQKVTQHIHPLNEEEKAKVTRQPEAIPKSLKGEIEEDPSELRSYRTDVHFTVEKNGLQGVLQIDGYTVPNPVEPNRFTIWITGGRCYAVKGSDRHAWREIFGGELPKRGKRERLGLWLAKLLMGAEPSQGLLEDESLRFIMRRPVGGHKSAYQQVVFLDDDLRITNGNRGTTVVVTRV